MDASQKKNATRFVLLTVFAYSMGFGIIMPVLPELIVELEGVSMSEATLIGGFVASAYAVFQFLMGPLVGNLGDRFGRRPIFLLSLAGFSIDFLLMGFAPNIIWLFVGRSVAGGLGAIFGPANAAMADLYAGNERAKSFGMVGATFGIGFIFGPVIGGFLGELGTRAPFFAAAALAAITFVYGLFAFPETMNIEHQRAFSLKRANPIGALLTLRKIPGVMGIVLIYFIWVTSSNIYPVVWSYFAPIQYGWSSKMVGLSLSFVGISMVLVQSLLIGRMVRRFGERNTATVGLSMGILFMLCYAFIDNAALGLALCLLVGLQGMVIPSVNSMMSRRTPENMQGELQGFNGSVAAIAALIAPLIYNTTLSFYTAADTPSQFAGAPFVVSAIFGVVALIALRSLAPAEQTKVVPATHS